MTVAEMLYASLRLSGVLGMAGRAASTYEMADAFNQLNRMLDAWNTERLQIYAILRQTFTFSTPKEVYAIGTGGDFNTTRPVKIEAAGVLHAGAGGAPDFEREVEVINWDQYQDIRLKTLQSTYPTVLYYDRAYPLGGLRFWPIPTDSTAKAVLYVWQPIAKFASQGDTITLPPGYEEAIEYNLALRLAATHPGNLISPIVIDTARESKAQIKRLNLGTPPIMEPDPGVLGTSSRRSTWDWRTGNF